MDIFQAPNIASPLTHREMRERINQGFADVTTALNALREKIITSLAPDGQDRLTAIGETLHTMRQHLDTLSERFASLKPDTPIVYHELEDPRDLDNMNQGRAYILLATLSANDAIEPANALFTISTLFATEDGEISEKKDQFRALTYNDQTVIIPYSKGVLHSICVYRSPDGHLELWGTADFSVYPGQYSNTFPGSYGHAYIASQGYGWKVHPEALQLNSEGIADNPSRPDSYMRISTHKF